MLTLATRATVNKSRFKMPCESFDTRGKTVLRLQQFIACASRVYRRGVLGILYQPQASEVEYRVWRVLLADLQLLTMQAQTCAVG